MKKNLFIIGMIFLLIQIGQTQSLAGTAHSTNFGGAWNSLSTWIEGFIPGSNDTAIIQGPVIVGHVVGYSTYDSYGGWVIVEPGGTLKPSEYGGGLGTFTLYVEHDIVNNGSIIIEAEGDVYEYLKLSVKGNITNNASWRPWKTELTGNGQTLTLGEGSRFGGWWENISGNTVNALTDLHFDCRYYLNYWETGDFNLHGSNLYLGTHSINTTGTIVYNGSLEGDFGIKGRFAVNKSPSDTLKFMGTVTVVDTLENNVYGGGLGIQNLLIEGDLINNGVIRDDQDAKNDDRLSMLISGDIINNGIWTCYYVNLVGDQQQSISQATGKKFDSYFADLNSESSILAATDINILNDFNLGGTTLLMENHMLTIDGWLYNGFIKDCLLKDAYIQNLTSLDNLEIYGKVSCDEGNILINTVKVIDTLQSNEYGGGSIYYDLEIDGDLLNEGVIQNNNPGDMLRLNISGNINNQGIWENAETVLTGSGIQQFTQYPGTTFGGNFTNLDGLNTLIAASDLAFSGNINLDGANLQMDGKKIILKGWLNFGRLDNAELHGGFLQHMECRNNLNMFDRVTVDDGVSFQGQITVNDTLIPLIYGGGAKIYQLYIEGDLINHGIIMDNYSGEMLQININGNLTNNGDWINYLTHVYVSNEQYIELIDDKPIEGAVEFDAVISSETYQWYYDDNILDSEDFEGETSQVLSWLVPVSSEWYGSFYCETGAKESVGILIKKGNLGIVEPVQELDFTVYPNPCWDKIQISKFKNQTNAKLKTQNPKLEILDLHGRVVYEERMRSGEEEKITVDVSRLPAGLYLVKLQTEDAVGVQKFIKK